jgi:hypothetical protein
MQENHEPDARSTRREVARVIVVGQDLLVLLLIIPSFFLVPFIELRRVLWSDTASKRRRKTKKDRDGEG